MMLLAHELHVDIEEIGTWEHDKVASWIAFFKYRRELEDREQNKRQPGKRARRGMK